MGHYLSADVGEYGTTKNYHAIQQEILHSVIEHLVCVYLRTYVHLPDVHAHVCSDLT
jgi:hypothetical protein